jgi:hypothetical protein
MADPNKFKSVSVPVKTYKMLNFLAQGKLTDADLTISKTIEVLATKEAKKTGYKNGKE